MRLGLLTQWYDPEPGPAALPGVLARGLVARGHEVRVLTGFPNYPSGQVAAGYRIRPVLDETLDGVRVRRVALYPSHDASFGRRAANYLSFGLSALTLGTAALRGLDALWVNYSPVAVAPAMWAARYALGVPLVVHVGDLWPDTLTAGGFSPAQRWGRAGAPVGAALDRGLHAWCDAMYAAAHVVTYIAPGVGDVLAARGVPRDKLAYAPMWADETTFAPADEATRARGLAWRRELGVDDRSVLLLYAGALGAAQGLQTLLEAVAGADETRLECVIAGSGVAEAALRRQAARLSQRRGRELVRFVGRVPQSRMPVLMAAADACYVGLARDPLSRITMPSKTQATLAAAKALLVAADGDVRRVVADAGAGWSVGSGDVAGLTRELRSLCEGGRAALADRGEAGRRYYVDTFAVERAVSRAQEHLGRAARSRRPARPRDAAAADGSVRRVPT